MCPLQKGEVGQRYLNSITCLPPLCPQTHKCQCKHSAMSVKLNIFHFPVVLLPYLHSEFFQCFSSVMWFWLDWNSHGDANFHGKRKSKFLIDCWRKLLGKQPVHGFRIPWSREEIFLNTVFLSSDSPTPQPQEASFVVPSTGFRVQLKIGLFLLSWQDWKKNNSDRWKVSLGIAVLMLCNICKRAKGIIDISWASTMGQTFCSPRQLTVLLRVGQRDNQPCNHVGSFLEKKIVELSFKIWMIGIRGIKRKGILWKGDLKAWCF